MVSAQGTFLGFGIQLLSLVLWDVNICLRTKRTQVRDVWLLFIIWCRSFTPHYSTEQTKLLTEEFRDLLEKGAVSLERK